MSQGYLIQSLQRAIQIIEALSNNDIITIGELSLLTDLPKSTVHRVLMTLRNDGFVDKDELDRFSLSMKFFEIGSKVRKRLKIKDNVLPYLRDLCQKSNETIYLGVKNKEKVIYVEKISSNQALQMAAPIGSTCELHSTGIGKVFLAHLSFEERKKIYNQGLVKFTDKTIVNPDFLEKHLQQILLQGFSIDQEETYEGMCSVAAPILNFDEKIVAAISIAVPSIRFTDEKINFFSDLVKETGELISKSLGFKRV